MFNSNLSNSAIRKNLHEFKKKVTAGKIQQNKIIEELMLIFGNTFSFPTKTNHYLKDTKFYRARSIPDDDHLVPLRTINTLSDAWEPPRQYINKQGRLNNIGESILYCCPENPSLAINEARAQYNKRVAVIVYTAIKDIQVSVIGDYEKSSLPKDESTSIFYEFLQNEFARFVTEGNEKEYSITKAIADTYYNYPNQDAWCYRSVQAPSLFNIAFLPNKAKPSLQLNGVLICNTQESNEQNLQVISVVDFDPVSTQARYHSIGSIEQELIFPEITSKR